MNQIKEKAQEAKANFGKNRIRWIDLKDGDIALLRFITDQEDIIQAEMHSVKKMTPRGEFFIKEYCKSQDNQPCELCAQGVPTSPMYFMWAYVYDIMRRQQNPRLARFPDAEKWERVVVKDIPFFKEAVNGPAIFRIGPGKDQKYKNMLVNFADEYGTLCDRDYKLVRTGGAKETTDYSLIAKDPKKASKEVLQAKKDVPELADVVSGKIKSLDGEELEQSEPGKAATDPAELF